MEDAWTNWLEHLADQSNPIDITVFGYTRCATNYYIAARTLPEHLFYLIQEHAVHVQLQDSELVAEPGQLLWLPPGTQHSFSPARTGTRVLVYHHRFTCVDGCPHQEPLIIDASAHTRERFAALYDGHDLQDPLWLLRYRASLILTFAEISEHLKAGNNADGSLFNAEQRKHIMQLVDENLWIDAELLARALDYHPAYFTRLFKRSFGQSPRSWILTHRMHRASTLLLESEHSIADIAAEIGYGNPFLFSRQFKQVHKVSPRDFRKQHSGPRQL